MNAEKLAKIQSIAASLRELFPVNHVSISVDSSNGVTVSTFEANTYAAATKLFREWGIGHRVKDPTTSYTTVEGGAEHFTLRAFVSDLPPTCKKVKIIDRIPKTQTVETGEFILVEREKIVCGNEQHQEA